MREVEKGEGGLEAQIVCAAAMSAGWGGLGAGLMGIERVEERVWWWFCRRLLHGN